MQGNKLPDGISIKSYDGQLYDVVEFIKIDVHTI